MKLVIKIGTQSILSQQGKPLESVLSSLAEQIVQLQSQGHQVALVSSGAVGFGRSVARQVLGREYGHTIGEKQLLASLGQHELMRTYAELFKKHNILASQLLLTKQDFHTREHYRNITRLVSEILAHPNVLAIINENDSVSIEELMFTDNDELSGIIAAQINADKLIILSNVEGVYTGNPNDPLSSIIPTIDPDKGFPNVLGDKSEQGRGGMQSKLETARKMSHLGIKTHIASMNSPSVLIKIMNNESIGTTILPSTQPANPDHDHFHLFVKERHDTLAQSAIIEHIQQTKIAAQSLALLSEDKRNAILQSLSKHLRLSTPMILNENKKDLEIMDKNNPMYDRLLLTEDRINSMANDIEKVAALPSPVGTSLEHRVMPNGLMIDKVAVPLGVVAVIYESRPNVTIDVFTLCFKTGNACILKGGKEAFHTNSAFIHIIHAILKEHHISTDVAYLFPPSREETAVLLNAVGLVDVCIPRGSQALIDYVRNNAHVPVIETGAGIVHTYFDREGDLTKGTNIINNAKTRRISVCSALDSLVIHRDRLNDLPELIAPLTEHDVVIYADDKAYAALSPHYPSALLQHATPEHFGQEFLAYKMAIKTVSDVDEAIAHIMKYTSHHSEAIITENAKTGDYFVQRVDAAVVYINTSTAFTDGGQFGLGAEIGISTQKLHARGPMGLAALTSYQWVVRGNGQVRL
jgi:glutamate-5-semialdehyde dehydrogenase